MTSTLTTAVAAEHRAELRAQADRYRLARAARAGRGVRVTWFAPVRPGHAITPVRDRVARSRV